MIALRIAAIFGFLAVALGAFGAHGLKEVLERHGTVATWHTGALYHLVHAVVLLVLAMRLSSTGGGAPSLAFWLFAAGIVVFSGSLYLYSTTGVRAFARVTPLGGLSLLAGWLVLAIRGLR